MRQDKRTGRTAGYILLGLKYLVSIAISAVVCASVGDGRIFLLSLLELLFIGAVCNRLIGAAPGVGHPLHGILLLLFNLQMFVLYFGSSFTTVVMLSNLHSLQDLSGNFAQYLMLLVPLLVITLWPTPALRWSGVTYRAAPVALGLAWLGITLLTQGRLTPIANTGVLIRDEIRHARLEHSDAAADDEMMARFHRDGVADHIAKPEGLPEMPNVVVVFVEGLSQSIVEDSRGLMSNLAELERRSLFFENYYNHTFATYRALNGQLYSGFQLSDLDANKLISLQSIFRDQGYFTSFLNTEPTNGTFTNYLSNMDFDNLITNPEWAEQVYATLGYISDKNALEHLMEMLSEQHRSQTPFFTAIYTFGTHASLDSPDEVYGDGRDAELNKFYNLDCQLGAFIEAFEQSELYGDTVLVVTADHATYQDKAFNDAFPDYKRSHAELDRIPLIIYYSGVTPEVVDVAGRNTLDLAPTLLDYLDISAPNYFLGDSLYADAPADEGAIRYDTLFFDGLVEGITSSVNDGKIEDRAAIEKQVADYITISRSAGAQLGANAVNVTVSDDCANMHIVFRREVDSAHELWFAVWGRENGNDDLRWYRAEQDENGNWTCDVRLSDHGEKGFYTIRVHEGRKGRRDHGEAIARGAANVNELPPEGGGVIGLRLPHAISLPIKGTLKQNAGFVSDGCGADGR